MEKKSSHRSSTRKDIHLYAFIICAWTILLIWFHPRLVTVSNAESGGIARASWGFCVFLIEVTWLYGFYNIGIILFAWSYRRQDRNHYPLELSIPPENCATAILYLTCNDFVEASAYSCVNQNYPDFTVYILDDSTDTDFQKQIDHFANRFPNKVYVIRRPDRRGFKAGNLNHALSNYVKEPFFAIADADEILPHDFLRRLMPILVRDERCGFVQANHHCNPNASNLLRAMLGIGIDIHWRWYQPLRNKYGFVMFLGHGAVLRRECWEKVGGFPEIVSEDLAYAIRLRDEGWYGRFAQDIICYEEFPESVRSFRIRHMKWTRGTCELLTTEMKRILLSRNISPVEKLDILFPVMNLPFSTAFFPIAIFMGLIFWNGSLFSNIIDKAVSGQISAFSASSLKVAHHTFTDPAFLLITLLCFIAPILCFLVELYHRPLYLLRFLCNGFVLYAGLLPLSIIGVLAYLITGRAAFLVTGDQSVSQNNDDASQSTLWWRLKSYFLSFFYQSHPDHNAVKGCELVCGLFLICYGILSFQSSLIGLALAFFLQPVMHTVGWENQVVQRIVILPYPLIAVDVLLRALILFVQGL